MQKKSLNISSILASPCHLWWLHSYKSSDVNIFKVLLLSLMPWLQMLFSCKYSFDLCYFLWPSLLPSPFPSAFLLSLIHCWNFRLPKLNMNTQYFFSKISVPCLDSLFFLSAEIRHQVFSHLESSLSYTPQLLSQKQLPPPSHSGCQHPSLALHELPPTVAGQHLGAST